MSTRLRSLLMQELPNLRHEPIEKRIRAVIGDETVVDSTAAILVWEPKRVVPSYAIPVEDVRGELVPAATDGDDAVADRLPRLGIDPDGPPVPVLDPSIPFAVHTADGEPLTLRTPAGAEAAAFRPADPELSGFAVLDFTGFDAWYEEDERNLAHPRDPFHRIDIVHSSRHVRVSLQGETLAESRSPCLLFEPPLPFRTYLPVADVAPGLLRPSEKRTFCAYKGQASYLSLDGEPDIAWTYPEPLREAAEVTGRIAFFDERVDVEVDGRPRRRPVTPWSPR
jgi:uncharacterized protein (DUF427 family)